MKSVLFVDDEQQVLEGLRDALRPWRREWRMRFADGGGQALAELAEHEFDVVVCDMRMPGMDGASVLRCVQREQPATVRIVLSGYAELDVVARASAVAHRFLAKPCDIDELADVVGRSLRLNELNAEQAVRLAATGTTSLPCVPRLFHQLTAALGEEDTTAADVAQIVAQDVAMTAKVLQLVNSAFFRRRREISRLDEAVHSIGLNALRTLVLSAEALEAFRPSVPIDGFSIEGVQRHGELVGRVAAQLLPPGRERDEAFAAGLLHDIGQLVLANRDPAAFSETVGEAVRDGRPLGEVERERFGVMHSEIGGYLLALWGLPHGIVEAVAFRDAPHEQARRFDAVAAVHVADVLVSELEGDHAHGPVLDAEYLDRLGVLRCVPEWQAIAEEAVGG